MTDMNNFCCSHCKFNTVSKSKLQKHYTSKKHIQNVESPSENGKFQCHTCNKHYKGASGLWAHKKKCVLISNPIKSEEKNLNETDMDVFKNMFVELKNQHESAVNLLKDQILLSNEQIHSRLDSMAEKSQSITTINNAINNEITNNNTFNINVFLKEECNKAINLDDFIKNICYEMGDFKKMLEDYVEGSMSILSKNMNQIPLNMRPMHYLEGEDNHQQIFHIRQNDIWKTETEINWLKQINADDDDVLEKQTIYFALKQLDKDKLEYLRYKYSANHDYMKNHKRLNCEVTRVDKKMKLYDEVIKMIKLEQ